MVTYSHSRIKCFENCPYQYKLKYIDKVKVDIPTTIEAFMGDLVHRALEKLYRDLGNGDSMAKESLVNYFNWLWKNEFVDEILIVKANQGLDSETYREKGVKILERYYGLYFPFDDVEILGLETKEIVRLPDGNSWHVRIDKLGKDKEGNIHVIDYKTGSRMISQMDADCDEQLAMYSFWVIENLNDYKKIILRWKMLMHGEEIFSTRTVEELEKLKLKIINKIRIIESTTHYPFKRSVLCNYCIYQNICPAFRKRADFWAKYL
ncbi:MAG: PD-(D/E)XK nuclease family protein [archaeon]